ncbi:MAG: transposase [Chromatiaceae bacterium]|nr:transposase [Chromatiaceae bacterium]
MAGTLAIQEVLERFPEEQTPLVRELLRIIRQQQDIIDQQQKKIERLEQEIRSLKGTQDKSPPPTEPSGLNETSPPSDRKGSKGRGKRGGKRPGSAKRSKTRDLTIHKTVPLTLTDLPDGTKFLGYENFTVQDLIVESHNTLYLRGRYRLPDGSFRTAPLPEDVVGSGHFGPTLRQYVLYQHFHNHVTQPLLHEELLEFGVDISTGQISRLLTEGHDVFHQEKDSLLPAAREMSSYLQTDHTPARHRGQPGQTLHIGNDLFASFSTIDSKSRVDFLKCLLIPHTAYVFDRAASVYLALFDVPQKLQDKLDTAAVSARVVETDEAWEQQLDDWEITSAEQRRLVTEAALWSGLLRHELYLDTVFISDDAAAFRLLGFFHSLCWVHQERHITRLVPETTRQQRALDQTRDDIWKYYQRLKRYQKSPTPQARSRLEQDFDRLFRQKTGWPALNQALEKIHGKRDQLLLVLDRPEIPLHNNLSENDIRQYVKKRKISAGTRSDAGRRSRDTFLSLKTTCRKLGQSFWQYLQDRIQNLGQIPSLGDLIRRRAAQANNG